MVHWTDTLEVAESLGVTVLTEYEKGYGAACLKAIDYLSDKKNDIVVFLDADYSDYPEEMNLIVEPIIRDDFDLVIGSRMLGK